MSEACTHNCETCGQSCAQRSAPQNMMERPHPMSSINRVIGVVSGKGGVGKSLVTSLLAVLAQRQGLKVGILDADITGPSIPRMFGVHEKAMGCDEGILPAESKTGVKLMSINLLLERESDPVVWRGPVIAGAVGCTGCIGLNPRIHTHVFVDMPPGTGDGPLTVFQSLPVDGIIIVASPQELVGMIVSKAVEMAKMMDVPVLGLVENMSYVACPDCGKKIYLFGQGKTAQAAERHHLPVLAEMPIDPALAALTDAGDIESFQGTWLDGAADKLEGK